MIPGTPAEVAALGYLHVNCGSCHNTNRPAGARFFAPPVGFDLWLRVDSLTNVATTPTYQTAIPRYVTPGRSTDSELLKRVANPTWFWQRMPPIATEVVDDSGARVLSTWIAALPR